MIINVIPFEGPDAPGRHYHFRFDAGNTSSFQALPPADRAALQELYVDYFFRRQDAFWMREAMQKLPALKRATNMLVCGEDLGLVPPPVRPAMRRHGVLGMHVVQYALQPDPAARKKVAGLVPMDAENACPNCLPARVGAD